MTGKRISLMVLVVCLNLGAIWSGDLTRQPGAKGSEVVDAVVDLIHHTCMFPDDKFFLRRLALVESLDGRSGNTYRPRYYGGIWQVDEGRFNATKATAPPQRYFTDIQNEFQIDWNRVTWEDLKKPLYSGLAARLSIEVINNGVENNLPRDVNEQAVYWSNKYHGESPRASSNFTAIASLMTQGCTGGKAIDLVFILDTSGSVAISDFEKAKVFAQRVVNAFVVDWEHTRVAAVKYSSQIWTEFYLDTFRDKQSVLNRIQQIQYQSGGTNTAGAIEQTVTGVFNSNRGARELVPKVAILVTDGHSNNFRDTSLAASRARDKGITMFAVGVGSINVNELNEIATDPDCTHVYTVQDFAEIKALIQEIQKASCHAKIQMPSIDKLGKNSTEPPKVFCNLDDHCSTLSVTRSNKTSITNETSPSSGGKKVEAVVTTVTCASAIIYASYNNPNPGVAYYEIREVATLKEPAVIYLNKADKPLYISVQGTSLKVESNGTISCVAETSVQEINPNVEIQCIDKGVERNCLAKDLSKFRAELCREPWTFPNPCTKEVVEAGKTLFPHPYDSEMYLMCDMSGEVYIVRCPPGKLYHSETQTCGGGTSPGENGRPSVNITNPCTAAAIFSGDRFFPYPSNEYNFIHCDVWGKAWTMDCPEGFVWHQKELKCVVEGVKKTVPGLLESGLTNPCTKDNIANKLFHPYPKSNTMYIHCDMWGQAWVVPCNPGFIWHDDAVTCVNENVS